MGDMKILGEEWLIFKEKQVPFARKSSLKITYGPKEPFDQNKAKPIEDNPPLSKGRKEFNK